MKEITIIYNNHCLMLVFAVLFLWWAGTRITVWLIERRRRHQRAQHTRPLGSHHPRANKLFYCTYEIVLPLCHHIIIYIMCDFWPPTQSPICLMPPPLHFLFFYLSLLFCVPFSFNNSNFQAELLFWVFKSWRSIVDMTDLKPNLFLLSRSWGIPIIIANCRCDC
jgi:hypothetical protein